MAWRSLGTVTPILGAWREFPEFSVNGGTFRFTAGNLGGKSGYPDFKSFALVRFNFPNFPVGSEPAINYTTTRRIYPRPDPVVFDFAPPEDVVREVGGLLMYPEVQLRVYKRLMGLNPEPAWTIKIEEFNPSQPDPVATLEQAIEDLQSITRFLY